MACGCNKKGTVSISNQLPPGCDSILSINSDDIGTETIVTITFCSGAIQQFNIPHGQDGSDGTSGSSGNSGSDGNGINDITANQDGTEVTLTITLDNGDDITIVFEVPTAAGAYVVQHLSHGTAAPETFDVFATKVLNDITGDFSVIKGTVPGNTIVNAGDTLHWDAVFNVTSTSLNSAHDIFKKLFLCVGNSDTIQDKVSNLLGDPANITIRPTGSRLSSLSVHVNLEMSKTNSPTRQEVMIKGTMSVYDKGANVRASHDLTDNDSPSQLISTVGIYTLATFTFGLENHIQLIGEPGGFGGDEAAINLDSIYMTVTKIPKI